MLEKKGFTTTGETDKFLYKNVISIMMLTSSVSCIHLSPVNDPVVSTWQPPIVVL